MPRPSRKVHHITGRFQRTPPAACACLKALTMHDEMNDLAPALFLAVIVAIGLVAFQFHSVAVAKPAPAVEARIAKPKSDKAMPQVTVDDRLHWIR
jgi:hypothetical protein